MNPFKEWFHFATLHYPVGTEINLEMAFNAGRRSIIGKYETDDSAGIVFAKLHRESEDLLLRLYGIIWWLVENELISEGKARELGKMPLDEMRDEIERSIGERNLLLTSRSFRAILSSMNSGMGPLGGEMKFVRWLGAFGTGASLTEATEWELSQTDRQVAVEPLHRGRSLLHSKIGLEVDQERSVFVKAWLRDAFTVKREDGTLRPKYSPRTRQGQGYKSLDRFLAAWSAVTNPYLGHAEAVFDSPIYSAVVVKSSATEHGRTRAARLADNLGLPLKELID